MRSRSCISLKLLVEARDHKKCPHLLDSRTTVHANLTRTDVWSDRGCSCHDYGNVVRDGELSTEIFDSLSASAQGDGD